MVNCLGPPPQLDNRGRPPPFYAPLLRSNVLTPPPPFSRLSTNPVISPTTSLLSSTKHACSGSFPPYSTSTMAAGNARIVRYVLFAAFVSSPCFLPAIHLSLVSAFLHFSNNLVRVSFSVFSTSSPTIRDITSRPTPLASVKRNLRPTPRKRNSLSPMMAAGQLGLHRWKSVQDPRMRPKKAPWVAA